MSLSLSSTAEVPGAVGLLQPGGTAAIDAAPASVTQLDPTAPWLFVSNSGSSHNDPQQTRAVIEAAMTAAGRRCEFLVVPPAQLVQTVRETAARAHSLQTALVGVGGDGTINTVAQAAHAARCAMGFVPQGTFNYFGREHRIPLDAAEAVAVLLRSRPQPVQVGFVNGQLFLVNASVGMYPELFEDREAWKRRFGRNRLVAILSSIFTLLTRHRQLRLHIEVDGIVRNVSTPTLFVGNNRLQLERVGLPQAGALDQGQLAAVLARDTTTLSMLWLLLRGAMGTLGDVETVEGFGFRHMTVTRRGRFSRRHRIKLAFDGEVTHIEQPLEFRVAGQPLYLIRPAGPDAAAAAPG